MGAIEELILCASKQGTRLGLEIALLRDVLRSLPHCAVFVVDAAERIIACGGEVLTAANFTAEEHEGKLLANALPSGGDGEAAKAYRRAINGESGTLHSLYNGVEYEIHFAPLSPIYSGLRGAVTLTLVKESGREANGGT